MRFFRANVRHRCFHQIIQTSLPEAWRFFSDPRNLSKLTPPTLGFEILSPDLPSQIYAGMLIQYRVLLLLGIPMTWLTEITQVRQEAFFIDEQRVSPYALWHHEHHFRALDDGTVEMKGQITYRLPFQPLGEMAHGLVVRPQLKRIFALREQAMQQLFPH